MQKHNEKLVLLIRKADDDIINDGKGDDTLDGGAGVRLQRFKFEASNEAEVRMRA